MNPEEEFQKKQMYRIAMIGLQDKMLQTFNALYINEQFQPMRKGLINLYRNIIKMAEYRIEILEQK
jgi:hypothetical protein